MSEKQKNPIFDTATIFIVSKGEKIGDLDANVQQCIRENKIKPGETFLVVAPMTNFSGQYTVELITVQGNNSFARESAGAEKEKVVQRARKAGLL